MSQETFTEPKVEIIDEFSPLDAPVKQRAYTQHHVADAQVVEDLEEPTFQPPSFNDFEDGEGGEPEPERPFNQSYSELDGKEKTMGAKMMVEMTLDLYEKGCGILGKLPEISEGKLDRLIAEGEIDGDIQNTNRIRKSRRKRICKRIQPKVSKMLLLFQMNLKKK